MDKLREAAQDVVSAWLALNERELYYVALPELQKALAEQPSAEAVAWIIEYAGTRDVHLHNCVADYRQRCGKAEAIPLYTHPARSATNQEIITNCDHVPIADKDCVAVWRAAEAFHGIKPKAYDIPPFLRKGND